MTIDAFNDVKALLDRVISTFSVIELKRGSLPVFQLREAELKLRRVRDRHFPEGYFGGSAWDLLLELDRAERFGHRYSVTDIGIDAKIPPTTALRYLLALEKDGHIARHSDPADRRRVFVRLTDQGRSLLDQIFDETIRSVSPRNEDASEMILA
jgi:DNA-binding MarR family transcriptional regulator